MVLFGAIRTPHSLMGQMRALPLASVTRSIRSLGLDGSKGPQSLMLLLAGAGARCKWLGRAAPGEWRPRRRVTVAPLQLQRAGPHRPNCALASKVRILGIGTRGWRWPPLL